MARSATTKSPTMEEKVAKQPPEQHTLSFLDQLEFVPLTRTGTPRSADQKIQGRLNVAGGIKKQIDAINGIVPAPTTFTRTSKNGTTREVTREFVPWYSERDGGYVTEIKYGQMALFKDANGDPRAVKAGKTKEELITFYDRLRLAVEAGELDVPIRAAQDFLARSRTAPPANAQPASQPELQEAAE